MSATRVLRHSPWDGALVALAFAHGALLVAVPSIPLIAVLLWWNANTISHNFIHLPFFRARRLNAAFGLMLTLLLGFPQSLWRARHLAHHAGRDHHEVKWSRRMTLETMLVATLWTTLATVNLKFYLLTWLPGYLLGLGLCRLQGYFEHARGTTSHYGRTYNVLFFRDGLHVEHHAKPSTHWTQLRRAPRGVEARVSAWPPVLRWLDGISLPVRCMPTVLDALERVVLKHEWLQTVVLRRHADAIATLLMPAPEIRRVAIIGGGLFPRTALAIRQLLPHASITIIDRSASSLAVATQFLGPPVDTIHADCDACRSFDADLVVVPLAFVGDRNAFYAHPPASIVIVHDWIWRRRGASRTVAWWLLKRVNLVRASQSAERAA